MASAINQTEMEQLKAKIGELEAKVSEITDIQKIALFDRQRSTTEYTYPTVTLASGLGTVLKSADGYMVIDFNGKKVNVPFYTQV